MKDPYSLHNIEEFLANLGPSKYITPLELIKGYHEVLMKPEHVEKDAFLTHAEV